MEEDGNFLADMDFTTFSTFPTDQFTADPNGLDQQQQVKVYYPPALTRRPPSPV